VSVGENRGGGGGDSTACGTVVVGGAASAVHGDGHDDIEDDDWAKSAVGVGDYCVSAADGLAAATGTYDRVLVDAECTHDGSIRHLVKFHQWGWHTFAARVMQPEKLRALIPLQQSLIR
jgi:hypothetical protein